MSVILIKRRSSGQASRAAQAIGLKTNFAAWDTEATGLIPYGPAWYWGYHPARPFVHAFCDSKGNTAYFQWKVDPMTREVIPDPHEYKLIRNVLKDPAVALVGHNIGYDQRLANATGIRLAGDIHDTQVLAHVATCGDELTYALKPLAKKYSGFPDDDEKTLEKAVASARAVAKKKGWLIAIGKKEVDRGDRGVFAGNKPVKADYWLGPPPLVKRYAIGDVERTMVLFLLWFRDIVHTPTRWRTYCREMWLFHVLRRMEVRGVRVYPRRTDALIQFYLDYKDKMRIAADLNGGLGLNFNSSPQMQRKFYGEKKYPIFYNEKTGKPTIDKNVLAVWGATDPDTGEYKDALAKAILEWKAADQTNKSFLKIYRRFWYPIDKKKSYFILHQNVNQSGAVTGRMSASDPNLMQVADADTGLRRAEIEQRPRECFGPKPRCIWYLPDFSQQEVWVFAAIAEEPTMMEILLSGHDFHQGVADRTFVTRADYQRRKKYYRKLSKLIMFGKLYGAGVGSEERPGRMTKLLESPFKESKEFIDSFEEQFTQVKTFSKKRTRQAEREGCAFNLYNREYKLEPTWAYKVINYLVQGTCADMMKMALLRLDWMLETRWPDESKLLGLINSIHDEIVIEVPLDLHCLRLMREIIYTMQMDSALLGIPVPIPVEMKVAPIRWAHTKKIPLEPWVTGKGNDQPFNLQTWVDGGIPRARTEYFADLERHMRACPYTTEESYASAFERTRTYLTAFLHDDAA